MCDKAVNTCPSTIKFVPEFYKTQKVCNKWVKICFFVFDSIPGRYKNQEMGDRVVSEDLFLTVYCPDKYITQIICDKAVDDSLVILKLILDWFVTSIMIKELFTALYADENILYFDEDFGNAVFSCNETGILNIDLNNNNNPDNNFDEDDPDAIIHIRLLAWDIKFQKCKALKELMSIALHPERWWTFWVSEHDKKEIEWIFTEGL